MRSYNTNTIFYNPGTPPSDPRDFTRFWMDESIKIQNAINALIAGHLDETNVAPTKPRTGDIRLADGTNWNPGSGAGFYGYHSGAWNKLG